jgi:hypothetical protein
MNKEQGISKYAWALQHSTFLVPCSLFYQIFTLRESALYIFVPGFTLKVV